MIPQQYLFWLKHKGSKRNLRSIDTMHPARFQWRMALGCALCLGGFGCAHVQDETSDGARKVSPEGQAEVRLGAQQASDQMPTHRPAPETVSAELNASQRSICTNLGLSMPQLKELIAKPLYEFNESEVDVYLRYLSAYQPDLPKRIVHLARKNLGQPYEIYLLGEMPFEYYDPQPLYCLGKSDCLVFTEHTYAMALTDSWPGFMRMLQRIRYRDGCIGVATRNHYTEADWNPNNSWLVEDITEELAGPKAVRFRQKVDRAKFLRNRYKLETDIPVEEVEHVFIRFEDIDRAKPHLHDGDFVNFVRGIPAGPKHTAPAVEQSDAGDPDEPGSEGALGATGMKDIFGGSAWVGHTGLVALGEDGKVHLIHSTKPQVREESIDDYIAHSTADNAAKDAAGQARLLGFKFLRLRQDPWKNLRDLDGEAAPRVVLPGGSPWRTTSAAGD
jgi:hypothetical protein